MASTAAYHQDIPWRLGGVGFSGLLAQVMLIREAGVWLRGNELIIGAMLAAWLAWGALGNMSGYWWPRRAGVETTYWLTWLAGCICAAAELVLLRCCWPWTGDLAGAATTMGRAVLLASVITALPSALHGFMCGALIRRWEDATQRSIAPLYMCETIGAALAGMLVTFVCIPLGVWWASVTLIVSVPVMITAWGSRVLWGGRACNAVCATALVAAWYYHGALETWAHHHASRFLTGQLVAVFDMPRVHLAVTRNEDEYAFYQYGRLTGSSRQREYAEELAGYALLAAGRPRRALVLGFPYTGLVRELAARGVDVTVLDAAAPYLAWWLPFLLPEDAAVLTSPHVSVSATDARVWLAARRHARQPPLDIVLQDIGMPESYATARYYSREWFQLVRARLADDGVLVVTLPGSAGHVPEDLARVIERMRSTLWTVFSNVTLIPASATLLLASPGAALPDEAGWWRARLRERGLSGAWFTPALLDDHLQGWRVAQFSNACARMAQLAPHTDTVPRAYGDAVCYYETRFAGPMHTLVRGMYHAPQRTLVCAAACVAVWLNGAWLAVRTRRRALAAWLCMTAVSAAGFVAQMTVIVRFVVQQGSVYYVLGALFASFMTGLALATWWSDRHAQTVCGWQRRVPLGALIAALLLTVCAPWPAKPGLATLVALALNAVAGAAVGAFLAMAAWDVRATRAGGLSIYAADICGALLGALVFSIIIPPVLGFVVLAALTIALITGIALVSAAPR